MKSKIIAAVVFACSGASLAWLALATPGYYGFTNATSFACAACFLAACVIVSFAERLAYLLALTAGIIALYRFSRVEFAVFSGLNSWILFNLGDGDPVIFLAKLRILFVVTALASTVFSLIRLLPAAWTLRQTPFRERTWPPAAVCAVVVIAWFAASVTPYRVPLIVDAVSPQFAILHVEKNGLQFHENAITVYRDGRMYVESNDRRLLQYRFRVRVAKDVLPKVMSARVELLADSSQVKNASTRPPVALRNWKAEGWYVRTRHGVLAFTTEYGTKPPTLIVGLFHDLESRAPKEQNLGSEKDVCLGFCYDPLAGLGFAFANQRCSWSPCK